MFFEVIYEYPEVITIPMTLIIGIQGCFAGIIGLACVRRGYLYASRRLCFAALFVPLFNRSILQLMLAQTPEWIQPWRHPPLWMKVILYGSFLLGIAIIIASVLYEIRRRGIKEKKP